MVRERKVEVWLEKTEIEQIRQRDREMWVNDYVQSTDALQYLMRTRDDRNMTYTNTSLYLIVPTLSEDYFKMICLP